MTKIKQIFIFAAGRGERMRPLTDDTPKPLINIKGRPIIEHILQKLPKNAKITVNGRYLAQKLQDYLPKSVDFSLENEDLETGGGLCYALQNGKIDENESILLINGDVFWQEESGFSEVEDFCRHFEGDILLGLKKAGEVYGYYEGGDFVLGENGDISRENERNSHVFVGLAVIDPKILRKAPKKCFSMGYFYKNADDLGLKIKGRELKSRFFHIGDVAAVEGLSN